MRRLGRGWEGPGRVERGVRPAMTASLWKLAMPWQVGCAEAAESWHVPVAHKASCVAPSLWWVGGEMAAQGLNRGRSAIWRMWEATRA